MTTPVPTLCRLEYLGDKGEWQVGHAGIALLEPHRYVERLAAKGKIGRAIVLDETLSPTGKTYASGHWDLL